MTWVNLLNKEGENKVGTILVFIIQCYEHQTDKGQLIDVVTCELIDEDLKSAMKKAKKIVKGKKNYRLSKVIEKEIG